MQSTAPGRDLRPSPTSASKGRDSPKRLAMKSSKARLGVMYGDQYGVIDGDY